MPRAGTVLTELVVVLALFSLIFFFSLSFIGSSNWLAVRQEVDKLSAAIRYLQRKAILGGQTQTMQFCPEKRTYKISDCTDPIHTLSSGVSFGVLKELRGPPSKPSTLIKNPISWPHETIFFYPDGTISAGALYFIDRGKSCCYALTCDASECTHIRIYRWDGQWKLLE